MPADNTDEFELLHDPSRAKCLDSLENHIGAVARLSRALWLATHSEMIGDEVRNVEGLRELANAVADHASAANYIFQTRSNHQGEK